MPRPPLSKTRSGQPDTHPGAEILAGQESPSCSQNASINSRDLTRHGAAEIVDTGQGSRFSGKDLVEAGKASGARPIVDSTSCWRDNVYLGSMWRSVKYAELYCKAKGSVSAARQGLAASIDFYNTHQPPWAQGSRQTPDMVCLPSLEHWPAAASIIESWVHGSNDALSAAGQEPEARKEIKPQPIR